MAFPTGWNYRQKLTIQSSLVSNSQTNAPVIITRSELHNDVVDPSGSANAQSNGGDIRFSSDSAGATQLPCEIVKFQHDTSTAAGDAEVEIWIKIPSVSSSVDTDFYIWYNTAGSDTQPAVTDTYGRNAVWSNYAVVYHLQEDASGGAGSIVDSTGNGVDLTPNGFGAASNATDIWGNTAGAINFNDASSEYLEVDTSCGLSAAGFYMSCLAKPDDVTTDDTTYMWIGDRTVSNKHYRLQFDLATGGIEMTGRNTTDFSSYAGTVGTGSWIYVGGEENSSAASRIATYNTTNGTAETTSVTFMTQNRTTIGRMGDSTPGKYMSGDLDEVKILASNPPTGWKSFEYNNLTSPSTFVVDSTPVFVGAAPSGGGSGLLLMGCG